MTAPHHIGAVSIALAAGPLSATELAAATGCSLDDLHAMAPALATSFRALFVRGDWLLFRRDESGSAVEEARRKLGVPRRRLERSDSYLDPTRNREQG